MIFDDIFLKVVEAMAPRVRELLTAGSINYPMADNRCLIIMLIITARHTRPRISEGSLDDLLKKNKKMLKVVMERIAAEVKNPEYHNLLEHAGRILQDSINKMGDIETQAQAGRRAEVSSLRRKIF
jgi:hypothetical protein